MSQPHQQVIHVGLVQMQMSADPDDNLRRALANVKAAAQRGAQVVCLPELFRSRYFPQREDPSHFALAESIPGPTTESLSEAASKFNVILIVPVFEKRAPGLYHNAAVLIDSHGAIIGVYRKMHVPDDPNFYEKYYFAPGDLGFRAFDTAHGKVGVLICWDQWYPEAARLTALRGAQILFYPTAIGWHCSEPTEVREQQLAAWQIIQQSHAIANGVFVVAVNRVGVEEELTFWGASFVADPAGRILAQASRNQEEVLVVPCDLNRIEEQRHGWPFLRDRRVEAYDGLMERYLG
ncbi:MAG: carbon-nitrogen hydrolase [Abditibacteriales bacterium]|nr:carbon-nitrogen hydrolase [Abditibacteriales bacterium]MDW8364601.1 carbon-nitrogen hydrolase [Abditibacteriales bacterium]